MVETCEDLSARRVQVGLVYEDITAVCLVVRPMLGERLQHLANNSRLSNGRSAGQREIEGRLM